MTEASLWSTWPPAPSIDARYAEQQRVRWSQRRPRVLVAHPDHHVRWFVSAALRIDDHHVACARTGPELTGRLAQWMVAGRPADLVLCGPRLSGIAGRELIAGLRRSDWAVPVLGVVGPHDRLHAPELAEADAVFAWPFDPDDLRTAVIALVDRAARTGGRHD